jgi:hypothetical protein
VSSVFWTMSLGTSCAMATRLPANATTSTARQKLAVLKMGPGMSEGIVRRRMARLFRKKQDVHDAACVVPRSVPARVPLERGSGSFPRAAVAARLDY